MPPTSLRPIKIHDKDRIEAYLRRNAALHIYGLGDLDERFWPRTEWHAVERGQDLAAIAFFYRGPTTTLLALCPEDALEPMRALLETIDLPDRFYAHLSPGLAATLRRRRRLTSHGAHLKMTLKSPSALATTDVSSAVPMAAADREPLLRFYAESYPGNWFDPWMLETGQYFAVREGPSIVAAAGVHVFSPQHRVAAIGNVATRPACRGRGLGAIVTAALCKSLLRCVELIGLNVHAENATAIRLYERLGFERTCSYEEYDAGPLGIAA